MPPAKKTSDLENKEMWRIKTSVLTKVSRPQVEPTVMSGGREGCECQSGKSSKLHLWPRTCCFLYKLALKNSSLGVVFIRLCSPAQNFDCSPLRGGATRASAPTALVRGMMHGMRLVGRAHWPDPCCPEESGRLSLAAAGSSQDNGGHAADAVGHESADILEPPGRNVHPGPDDAHSEGPKGVSLLVGPAVQNQ